jgi:GH15 family glucan-1,4-alpha-glucosidase
MYRNIADYGVIGDMRSAALVSADGSIDYCSLPWFDSPTVFAALLDDEKGGFFSIQPSGPFTSSREYVPDTNILSCTFTTATGRATLFDFMPVENTQLLQRPQGIHRCLRALEGSVDFVLTLAPRPGYASLMPVILKESGRFAVTGADLPLFLILSGPSYLAEGIGSATLTLSFSLMQGEEAHIDLITDPVNHDSPLPCPFDSTKAYWEEWLYLCLGERCAWLAEFTPLIHRSLLALKLLTFQPTGAITAAVTTSLPESPGGERNWDYRITWLRDASFTLKALFALGHIKEADSFIRWLHDIYRNNGSRNLQIMYSIHGEAALEENALWHLKGYRNSKPVRTGNGAWRQNQWDIYGEVMDAALRLSDYAGKIDEELWPFFRNICEMAIENWRKPDDGIWEVRNGPHHFVYSKVMCWVALDRGITIARRFGFSAPLDRWSEERDAIRDEVLLRGFSKARNSFVQRYDSELLDASLLLLPLVNFLPVSDSRVQGTIEACRNGLLQHGFVRRYFADDGLEGEEGGFVLCNFWLIECLALSGRIVEAEELLAVTMTAANNLGLFSEEYDPFRSEMLGNFPQAFSHIGYINAIGALLSGKAPSNTPDPELSLMQWLQRLIPLQLTLNMPSGDSVESAERIDSRLKTMLSHLQGAFFDTRKGRVNYSALKGSESFRRYQHLAEALHHFDPESLLTDGDRKAFWINIYNILIIHGVIALDIRRSVLEIVNFFGRIGYVIGGLFFSPDDIEHGILRKNRPHPAFPVRPFSSSDIRLRYTVQTFDPRIHFALVCASNSCPPIEFYDAQKIDQQLDVAARSFINRRGLEVDRKTGELRLSRIFQWYAGDFGPTPHELLGFIMRFADEDLRSAISLHGGERPRFSYLPYNWNLNSTLV